MKARHLSWLVGTIASYMFVTSAICQDGGNANSRGMDSAEALSSYGIELSEQSLRVALTNENPKIRVLAADRMAHDGSRGAMPAIEAALSIEKDPMTSVGIAGALVALHDPAAGEHLQVMCADTALPIRVVFHAVQLLQLFHLSSAECADAMIGSLTDADYRSAILSVLPVMCHEVPRDKSDRIMKVIEGFLSDKSQQLAVRMAG